MSITQEHYYDKKNIEGNKIKKSKNIWIQS
jgi:hypothetical protein